MPQKQPPASTAVSECVDGGTSSAGVGIATVRSAAGAALHAATAMPPKPARTMRGRCMSVLLRRAASRRGLDRRSFYHDRATPARASRSEEHTSELQSLMRITSAVFCLKKKQEHLNECQQHYILQ